MLAEDPESRPEGAAGDTGRPRDGARDASTGRADQGEDHTPAAPPAPPAAVHERRVTLQVGELFGLDVRPSRTFVWLGRRRPGSEAIVSLGAPPAVPRRPLEEHTHEIGATEITYAGSPAVTVPLTAYRAAREALRRRAARRDDGER